MTAFDASPPKRPEWWTDLAARDPELYEITAIAHAIVELGELDEWTLGKLREACAEWRRQGIRRMAGGTACGPYRSTLRDATMCQYPPRIIPGVPPGFPDPWED